MRIWLLFVLFITMGAKDIDHFHPIQQPLHIDRVKRPAYVPPPPEASVEPAEQVPPGGVQNPGQVPIQGSSQTPTNLERPLPEQPLSVEPTPQNPPPGLSPVEYPQNLMPPTKLPSQGTFPKIQRQDPIQLQDEGNYMSHPQPQRNPAPSAVFPARPGRYSPQRGKRGGSFPFHDHPRPMGEKFHAN
jgi:hypothetical protein